MEKNLNNRREFIKKTVIALTATGFMPIASKAEEVDTSKCLPVETEELDAESQAILDKPLSEIKPEEVSAVRKSYYRRFRKPYIDAYNYKGDGKWKIHMLGTSAGSEPSENRMFTSWVLEKPNGDLLWFDAGEPCGQTATLMGLNLLRAKHMFISHPHSDHICGLAGFFHTMFALRRICKVKKPIDLTVHISTPESVIGAEALALSGNRISGVKIAELLGDGEIYNDGEVSVESLGNLHMPLRKDGKHRSYSYRIKILSEPKKTIIFTGDIKDLDELEPFLKDACDLLMMENGHHTPGSTSRRLTRDYAGKVKELMIMHLDHNSKGHGNFEQLYAEKYWGKPIIFARDRMTLVL